MTMKELILKVNNPIVGILAGMYSSKEYTKNLMVTDEKKYSSMLSSVKALVEEKYLSVSRKGKTACITILKRGKEEINGNNQ